MFLFSAVFAVILVPGITKDSRSTHLDLQDQKRNLGDTKYVINSEIHEPASSKPESLPHVISDKLSSNSLSNHSHNYSDNSSLKQWNNQSTVQQADILSSLHPAERHITWNSGGSGGRRRDRRSADYDDYQFYYPRSRSLPTYETIFQPGMNCDFERDDCIWELFPKPNNNKASGSYGLTKVKGSDLQRLVNPRYKTDADQNLDGHLLMFKAGYTPGLSAESNHSYIESPRIDKSLSECTLSFYVMSTVEYYKSNSNDHAYFEVMIVDDSNGAVPLQPNIQENLPWPWTKLEYAVGSYNRFRIEIVFFKGINETRKSIFAIDNIKLSNCLKLAEDKPQECSKDKEYKCKQSGLCVSKSGGLCDYHPDCALQDDEQMHICDELDSYNGGYRCDFSKDYCDWSLSGPMKWERIKAADGSNFLNIDVSQYMNENLVTLGILRSPLFTPPPEYNENDTNPATFQSCELRLFFKATKTAKIDFFEVEIIEKTPLTKVSRGSRVIKPVSNKMKSFSQTHTNEWTKITAVIPRGFKYGYYIQLNAVKGPDASGPAYYNMSMANISLSPQCFGLGVDDVNLGCWRHDLIKYPRELADCMGVPYPEEPSGVFSYAFTTCAQNVGPRGPYKESCSSYYEYQGGNSTFVDMLSDFGKTYGLNKTFGEKLGPTMQYSPVGIQKWKAPYSAIFTVIAKGASGGHGRLVRKSSHAAVITVLLKLEKDDELYILVGQEGQSACVFQGVESKSGLCSLQGGELLDDPSAWRAAEATHPGRDDYYPAGNNNYLVQAYAPSGVYAPNKNDAAFNTAERARRSSYVYTDSGKIYQDSGGHAYTENGQVFSEFDPQYQDIMRRYHKAEEDEKRLSKEEKRKRRKEKKKLERSRSKENRRRHKGDYQSDSPTRSDGEEMIEGKEILTAPNNTTCDGENDCVSWRDVIKKYHPSYQIGGGGGGGATFIFKIGADKKLKPILIAGGGGGMADISGTNDPDAKLLFNTIENLTDVLPEFVERPIHPNRSIEAHQGGYGGGWNITYSADRMSHYFQMGLHSASGGSETESWLGGYPCNYRRSTNFTEGNVNIARFGGFGGGGGGCNGGGGGGGFVGGLGGMNGSENGYGGVSYYDPESVIWLGQSLGKHAGPGEVFIIPDLGDNKNLSQCRCYDPDSLCMPLNEGVTAVTCYCKNGKIVDVNVPCVKEIPTHFVILLAIGCIVVAAISGLICMCLYTQYQRRRLMRSKLRGPDGQLSMLRNSNGIMMTEYNPNYEFGGGACSLMDLKEVERDKIRLVKALGQGAFGEVYEGHYRKCSTDSGETAVAVKTLTELSTNQAEMDFLMEALIMSKFNHANIVQFIGVCFDKHPRYIILELLAGGDLKTFLRESRPKPDRPSSLTMRDLLSAAIDVCTGCSYLEENHFIHRDIAARNCLLTSKGPGRIVKIADFGMARDIYRADYYRKGGKAMLPVKWMPPEAFLDGIFTSKTDIWSFGILLWEVMSLGYMPYPGRGNQEVMQLVTNGGRLEPPNYCPGPLYGLMSQCWHPIPEERPNFQTISERLGYCLQDPEVVMAPLPVFHRPLDTSSSIASSRRDLAEGNSSGNSGSGGSVSIGTAVTQPSLNSHNDYMIPNTSSYPVPDINSSKSVRGSTDMLASNGLRCSTDMLPSNGLRCSTDNLTSNGLRCSTDVRLSDTDPQSVPLLQKETSFSVPQIIPHVQSNVQVARNGRIHSGRCSGKPIVMRRTSQSSSHHSPPDLQHSTPVHRHSPPDHRHSPPDHRHSPPDHRYSPPDSRYSPPNHRNAPPDHKHSPPNIHYSSDLVTESKSTEPLLLSSPSLSDSLDLEGIPPPPRPYSGPPPPPIPPPPHAYKDHALPLNPAQLRISAHSPPPPILPPPPSSYANVGVRDRNGNSSSSKISSGSSNSSSSAGSGASLSMGAGVRAGRAVNASTGEVYASTSEISV